MRTCAIIHPLHLELETALGFGCIGDQQLWEYGSVIMIKMIFGSVDPRELIPYRRSFKDFP
jgi:hypothetical protein